MSDHRAPPLGPGWKPPRSLRSPCAAPRRAAAQGADKPLVRRPAVNLGVSFRSPRPMPRSMERRAGRAPAWSAGIALGSVPRTSSAPSPRPLGRLEPR